MSDRPVPDRLRRAYRRDVIASAIITLVAAAVVWMLIGLVWALATLVVVGGALGAAAILEMRRHVREYREYERTHQHQPRPTEPPVAQ